MSDTLQTDTPHDETARNDTPRDETPRDDTARLDLVPDPGTGLTPADLRHAALAACSYATDAAEARELLDALGLLDELRGSQLLTG